MLTAIFGARRIQSGLHRVIRNHQRRRDESDGCRSVHVRCRCHGKAMKQGSDKTPRFRWQQVVYWQFHFEQDVFASQVAGQNSANWIDNLDAPSSCTETRTNEVCRAFGPRPGSGQKAGDSLIWPAELLTAIFKQDSAVLSCAFAAGRNRQQ